MTNGFPGRMAVRHCAFCLIEDAQEVKDRIRRDSRYDSVSASVQTAAPLTDAAPTIAPKLSA